MSDLERSFRNAGRKTKWKNTTVYSVYQLAVKPGDTIEVEHLDVSNARAQALHLGLDKGNLRANGVLMENAAVWSHTCPSIARFEVVGRKARSIDLWNGWSFEGVESAWLGHAGMIAEKHDDGVTLRCSDGLGEPIFEDLVVDVRVEHHG